MNKKDLKRIINELFIFAVRKIIFVRNFTILLFCPRFLQMFVFLSEEDGGCWLNADRLSRRFAALPLNMFGPLASAEGNHLPSTWALASELASELAPALTKHN